MTKPKTQYSSYWIGSMEKSSDEDESPSVRLIRLSSIRRGIANFVNILTGKDIPVRFSSGAQSYTTGEEVVISATSNPDEFDSMVGLALHEGSHIKYSKFLLLLLQDVMSDDRLVCNNKTSYPVEVYITPQLEDLMKKRGIGILTFRTHLKFYLNLLDDRRIDALSYETLGGYRPYYEAMYDRFFYNNNINIALIHPKYRKPYLRCYELHITNMINDLADPHALPGLEEIWKVINLPYIGRYNNDPMWDVWYTRINQPHGRFKLAELPLIVQDALKILEIIYTHMEYDTKNRSQNSMGSDSLAEVCEEDTDVARELDNLDIPDEAIDRNLSTKEEQAIERAMRKQRKFTSGDVRKQSITGDDESTMQSLESADAELREAGASVSSRGSKCRVIFYKKLTREVLNSTMYPFRFGSNYYGAFNRDTTLSVCPLSREAIRDGMKMGQILAHRLRFMNDESTLKFSRQNHGKLDKRLTHQLAYAADNVFSTENVVRLQPAMVDISIDSSGSMNGLKWQKALTLAVAMAWVAEKTRSVRIRISARTTLGRDAAVAILYDSKYDKFVKIRDLFPYIGPTGGTPEGLTYEAIQHELLDGVRSIRKYFVNLSDGEPCHEWPVEIADGGGLVVYSGIPAAKHTLEQVNRLRESGVRILSYFITEYGQQDVERRSKNKKSLFHIMYGQDATYISTENVLEIAKTLNQFFLKE